MSHKSPTSVTATWDDPIPGDHNGLIVSYQLILSEETGMRNWTLRSTAMKYDFEFLQEYYRYSLTVAAETVSLGPQSRSLIFTTLSDSKLFVITPMNDIDAA